jgi:hypothetical protein
MTPNAAPTAPETKPQANLPGTVPGKVTQTLDKAHNYVGTMSKVIGVVGAVGTLFVYLTSTFYVGDVQIQANQKVDAVEVKAYTHKGNEAVYHTMAFQLMPGEYHLEITPEGAVTKYADIKVEFNKPCLVPVEVVLKPGELTPAQKKLHWWQFWRKHSEDQ